MVEACLRYSSVREILQMHIKSRRTKSARSVQVCRKMNRYKIVPNLYT
jgi:hypothetical protein